jgi:Pectic acid lyase
VGKTVFPVFVGLLLTFSSSHASVVGTSQPAPSLTQARIDQLPSHERKPWTAYLQRSDEQMRADKAALAAECRAGGDPNLLPKEGFSGRSMPLHREAAFYKSDPARHTGDVIVSFQTPAGGWSKNLEMTTPRVPCERYATNNLSHFLGPDDFDQPRDPNWNYVGTLDNDATNTELHFLALLSQAWPGHEGDVYRASFLRGIEYLLRAQYPNGGWPQVWPLEGGYHDAITFNDDAVTESAETLTLASHGEHVPAHPEDEAISSVNTPSSPTAPTAATAAIEDYSFVPQSLRIRAAAAAAKALQCILATQVRVPAPEGKGTVLTIWAQQHDPLTLAPVSGRNFEPPALSTGESASVIEYLMSLPNPSPAVVRAVDAAAAWLESHKIEGYVWSGGRATPGGRKLTPQAGAPPLWARYYSLTTGKPIFGDRDKTIHDDVAELSLERRNGYAWYGSGPQRALDRFARWKTTAETAPTSAPSSEQR